MTLYVLHLMVAVATALSLNVQAPKIITSMSGSKEANQAGIQPLTSLTLAEAVRFGSEKPTDQILELGSLVAAYKRAYGASSALSSADIERLLAGQEFIKSGARVPFSVLLDTPFIRAATKVAEAKRKYESLPDLRADDLNLGKITIQVFPSASLNAGDTIENAVIRRGLVILRPEKTTVAPVSISNLMGAKRDTALGAFVFEFSALAPDGPVTLVLIGKSQNVELELSPEILKQLR